MPIRFATTLVAAALLLATTSPGMAQATDMAAFSETCMASRDFFAPDFDDATDLSPLLTPLCICLAVEFSVLPPEDVALLATDLAQTSTPETRAAHPNYEELVGRAGVALNKCFATPQVLAGRDLISAQVPDAGTPTNAP